MCGIPMHVKIETFINHVPITTINDQGGAIGATWPRWSMYRCQINVN